MKREDGEIVSYDRGEVVWGIDPFKRPEHTDTGTRLQPRPWLIVSDEAVPFHPQQYCCMTLTSRQWHEESIPVTEDDWLSGGAPESSAILPWSVTAIKHELLDTSGEIVARVQSGERTEPSRADGIQGRLSESITDEAVQRLNGYLADTVRSTDQKRQS